MASRGGTRRYVLDANALIGFLEDRAGVAEKVRRLMTQALREELPLWMSAVNWGEVFYMSWRLRGEASAHEAEEKVGWLPIVVVAVDQERATRAATLKQKHGLGYADSYAAELAMERRAWLVTADPDFQRVGKGLALYSLPQS
jgi:predicted nucleic acid-binding protein